MVKAMRISDAINKIVAKFFHIYEGPNKIVEQISISTYKLGHMDEQQGIHGVFNIRQLKKCYVGYNSVN